MTTAPHRPIARVVRILAVALVVCAAVLLTLGGLTTSFRAGMADPVWPTEPWYLIVNGNVWQEARTGFLLEHTHRLAGWTAGGLATILAFAAWLCGPDKRSRLFGLVSLVVLLATYGDFHRRMMKAKEGVTDPTTGAVHWDSFVFPTSPAAVTGLAAVAVLAACGLHLRSSQCGKWVRAATAVLLIAVMVQGLLGGFRVFLDQKFGLVRTLGVELSALHGVFAQVVFALMVCVPVLAAPRHSDDTLATQDRNRLGWLSLALPAAVVVQLVWAVWVRHAPTPLTQRLHFLTAFLVFGLAVWLAVRVRQSPHARWLVGAAAVHLMLILGVQVALGVEAWMGKFAAAGQYAAVPPELRPVTVASGWIRTLHQLVGTAILASSVVIALRVWRPSNRAGGKRQEPAEAIEAGEPISV
jgi:heme A synthase